jgi:peptidoglycan/xylan/chitin deacetylase (PgdA/CDA1 family)
MPGGFFLIGRWVHRFGSALHEGISFIGHDPGTRSYSADNFDNLGYHRTYALDERGGLWHFSGGFERATMRFDDDGNGFTVNWELSKDGKTWAPLCELRGTRLHG